jgi:hypothetical protein
MPARSRTAHTTPHAEIDQRVPDDDQPMALSAAEEAGTLPDADRRAAEAADAKAMAVEQLVEAATVGLLAPLPDVIAKALEDSRLDASEVLLVSEALPVGVAIVHEGLNRWRVGDPGKNQFGHGKTFLEAVESYVLGERPGPVEPAV